MILCNLANRFADLLLQGTGPSKTREALLVFDRGLLEAGGD